MTLTGAGGHTSRPHLTGDLVYALGQVITQVPAVLGRRLDPRSGRQPGLGRRARGRAHNAIPPTGARQRHPALPRRARLGAGAAEVLSDVVARSSRPYGVERRGRAPARASRRS